MTLLDLVQQDVSLTERKGEWWGLCPFHTEATPSFTVNPDRGVYYCFGCHAGGDAITYLRVKRGLSFRQACAIVGKTLSLPQGSATVSAVEAEVRAQVVWEFSWWSHRTLAEQCDWYRELLTEQAIAEIAYRATHRHPSSYSEDDLAYWQQYLADLYDHALYTEYQCDVLTYASALPERVAWWEQEQYG